MQISYLNMQILEWYLADLKSTGKKTIETVEKSLTDMFIRLVRIYPCLLCNRCPLAISIHDALNQCLRDVVPSPAALTRH